MKTIEVAASKTYNVCIERGLLSRAGELIRPLAAGAEKAAIITDSAVDPLYGDRLRFALAGAGFEVCRYVLPQGEESKNGENLLAILSFLAQNGLSRSDILVALGGGMVGDICGFAASIYMRGLKYVQIPTTLLAMVDSSVGGKTAIDLPEGKNLAGAFCQPETVLCDPDTLDTLPAAVFADGCAEVVKYGLLGDAELFRHLAEKGTDFDREYVLASCIAMKRDYVCADEFDTGERRKLNLGHTLGHAVEKESSFSLSHGKSVAIGLATVTRAAAAAGLCHGEKAAALEAALALLGLPVRTDRDMDSLMPAIMSDKKRSGSLIHVIVPEDIGRCSIVPMDAERLKNFMKAGL